jgi:hypothetical protein
MEKEILTYISELQKNISTVDLDKLDKNWKSYGRSKELYNLALIRMGMKKIRNFLTKNSEPRLLTFLEKIEKNFEDKKIEIVLEDLKKLEDLTKTVKQEDNQPRFVLVSTLPNAIKDDIESDLKELEKCFQSKCYRSSVILCGRILETALHRKHYDITGKDLLEKSPGIGLGKIIAKLKESKLNLDPGLSQQIHLINQVRIFSVHKKSYSFTPNKEQTHAVILYTVDILNKLFK